MKLFENAGFLGRELAVMVVGVLMLPTAWADGGYEQSGKNITVTGDAAITVTNMEFEIDVASGGNAAVDAAYPVAIRTQAGGNVSLRGDAWQDKVGLWLDASEEWTLIAATNSSGAVQTITDGTKTALISRWRDRRPEQTEWLGYNNRLLNATTPYNGVLPYVVSNGCNGLTYVTMGNQVQFGRRMPFIKVVDGVEMASPGSNGLGTGLANDSYTMDVKYLIMVFGSQNGGGQSIAGALPRASTSGTVAAGTGIFAEQRDTRVDGVAVNPTTTGMNGGWQVISFAPKSNETVMTLAGSISGSNYGGQNYAEVLVFTNRPSAYEIATIERYLANKWGVSAYSAGDDVSETRLFGTGTASVASGEVRLGGEFAGTMTVAAGATLTLTDTVSAPTNPASGMTGWFDPDRTDKWTSSSVTVDGESVKRIDRMYNLGPGANDKAFDLIGEGRGPRIVSDARGWGSAHYWCDYKREYTGSTGNTMRFNNATDGVDNCLPVRTGFMVLDTCEGAGTPFLDTSIYSFNGSSVSRYVMTRASASPIFRKQTGSASGDAAEDAYVVTNSPAYLDGMSVKSGKRGYNSRTELLSFAFSKEIPIRCFGSWQQANGYDGTINLRHGEIILYSTALSDADRKATEAYLMKKWLGKTPVGYGDPSLMTVAGAGTVKTANGAMRPKTAAGFTGTLAISDAALKFSIGTEGVADAISLPSGTLETANVPVVDLAFSEVPAPGTYALIEAANWNAATVSLGSVSGLSAKRAAILRLQRSGNTLLLTVKETGTFLSIR